MGDESDADWQAGLAEWGYEDTKKTAAQEKFDRNQHKMIDVNTGKPRGRRERSPTKSVMNPGDGVS